MVETQFVAALSAVSCCALLISCANSPAAKPDDIPANLRVPEAQVLTQRLHAIGVQIYVCQPAKNDATRFEWSFKAPEATLSTQGGKKIGKHYGGPSWEADDGSKVVGEVVARAAPDPSAIPWLLLSAKSTSGKGVFGNVTSIQRLNTMGGNADSGGCTQAQLGQELRAAYSADYLFYSARP
jgi:hypothetical protein